ncbi:LysM peptidoglycan-binding domain-containing protein [Virgibacillus sediminis]|uniref:LysM peptidoglycan-binding domain-containing protein n=1 Tax=Virgibacillus sediminis TaxID=202260 RepID=A0ABV7A9K1_9BACI
MQFFYTVRSGDTVSLIASRWALPVDSVIAANNMEPPYMIHPGQQISIPPGVERYRVQAGDTINSLSQRYRVPSSTIIEANRLQPPYTIQVGQLLRIPPGVPYYFVRPGDTLFQLANRFNVGTGDQARYDLIARINQLPSYNIYPGMRLIIPYAPPGGKGGIAYFAERGTGYDLWVYVLADGRDRRITNGLGAVYSVPYWAPDGTKIAFVGRSGVLYVVDLIQDRTAEIDFLEDTFGIYLDWSPDSRKLTYVKKGEIILYDVRTHHAERIPQHGATDVQWLPNGRQLLYQAPDTAGISQLFIIRPDGSGKRQITRNTGGRYNNVRVSPDGTAVLYTTPGVSISLIYLLDLTTGNMYEVAGGPLSKNYNPVWSPDSLYITYSATAFESVGYYSLIRTVNRYGREDRTRAISDCYSTPVTWSPDSMEIAYLSDCGNEDRATAIWKIARGHPVPIRLTEAESIVSLQWSPALKLDDWRIYTNRDYLIQLKYPRHWERVTQLRYEGVDGFFQISAIRSEEPLPVVCRNEAFHPLQPYGSAPKIISSSIQGQEACLIYPSADQPAEMRNQAALIVQYPQPVNISGDIYNYFLLWSDKEHLDMISSSLIFL